MIWRFSVLKYHKMGAGAQVRASGEMSECGGAGCLKQQHSTAEHTRFTEYLDGSSPLKIT